MTLKKNERTQMHLEVMGIMDQERHKEERLMIKSEQRKLIENAAEELAYLIRKINDELKSNITSTDLDEPDYYDYQTCYELMVLASEL